MERPIDQGLLHDSGAGMGLQEAEGGMFLGVNHPDHVSMVSAIPIWLRSRRITNGWACM
jgi:hypothetical protein